MPHGPSTALGPAPRYQHSICPSARATGPLPAPGHSVLLPTHAAPCSSFGSGPPRCPTRKLQHGPGHATCHKPLYTSARPTARARPVDRDQATSARTQHLMLNATAHGAALHAMLSCDVPALYPRQIPIVVVLRKHLTGTTTWARTSSSTRGHHRQAPRCPPFNPPARPAHDSSRAARRDEQQRWGGSTPTTLLLSVRGCHKGFDPPGQHNLPDISDMRKRA